MVGLGGTFDLGGGGGALALPLGAFGITGCGGAGGAGAYS